MVPLNRDEDGYRRTSPITIVGNHTARWVKQIPPARRCLAGSKLVERSPRHLCSAGYTIFTGPLHDKFLRPQHSAADEQFATDGDLGISSDFSFVYQARRACET